MESAHTSEEPTDLVRCLDCKTVYRRPLADEDADPCPTCGYVGWIVLNPGQKRAKAES
jgi:rRNA maturation endonuclease Nob1